MIRRPPRSTRTDTLFPYTTLFRSLPLRRHLVYNRRAQTAARVSPFPDGAAMVTATGREPRHQPASDPTRAILARRRRNLLLPILLLVAVSLVAVSGLLYWSAVSVNQREALAQQDPVHSLLQRRTEGLSPLGVDNTRGHWG